jgi:hypothetical protein
MDNEVITLKLESLRRSIHRVQTSCPAELAKLKVSLGAQDILTLNLMRAVQLMVDIGHIFQTD